ncbi:MAG: PQQ-binding-like beta-propeller repeat protein [Bacteroidota bacterium]
MIRHISIFILFAVSILSAQQEKNIWKAELDDDIKKMQPIQNGKYLFLWSDEYAWLFENATGKKIWSVEIEEYSDKAVHQVVNDSLYLVANEDTLVCYHMLQNSILWKKSYRGIEQDQFSGVKVVDTLLVLSYTKSDIGASLLDGTEAWRMPIAHQSSLIEEGTVNSIVLERLGKYIVFTENDECVLLSLENGKKLLSLPLSEPNSDLIKQHRAWYYISDDQKFAAFVFNTNYIVIDIEQNKMIAQMPVKISDQFNVLMPTAVGCAAISKDKLVHSNFITAKTSVIPIEAEKIRNIIVAQTDSTAVMIVGLEDNILGWNLDIGKMLWKTALKFQPANGFIHQFVRQDSSNVIVTYLDPSNDLKLYLMSIDALSGKINYRTFIAHADESLPKRQLPLPAIPIVTGSTSIGFGFEQIGFDYQVTVEDTTAKFIIRTNAEMIEPNTEKVGGEGLVLVDLRTGVVTAKNYLKVADAMSFEGGLSSIAKPLTAGGLIMLPGNKNLIALDAATGAVRWKLGELDLNKTFIFDMAMIDTVLYVRTGGFQQEYTYDAKKDKVSDKKKWEEDDYALIAVDTSVGKVLWTRSLESDPGRIFHDYSIANYTRENTVLFYSDEKFLYSLALDPVRKGMLTWKFEFSDSGIGTMDFSDLYQQTTHWSVENTMHPIYSDLKRGEIFPYKYTVAAGETLVTSMSKVLYCDYNKAADFLVIFGEDGLAAINPSNGKIAWYYEWDYSAKAVHHRPVQLKENIFYAVDGLAVVLNLHNGAVVAQTKLDKSNAVFVMPDQSSVIAIDKDEVTGIVIP